MEKCKEEMTMAFQQQHVTLPLQAEQTTRASVGADSTLIQTPSKATGSSRLVFVDHLKVALIILVVLHHFAVIYGANTGFYYIEPAYHDIVALVVLVLFQLLNQAYFMGLFFLISGYFTPESFDRKGAKVYLKERLLRLGIPTLLYMFILGPIAAIGIYQMPETLTKITTPFTWQQYPTLIGIGPMWFAVMLLMFECGYIAWRMAAKRWANRVANNSALPNFRVIFAFILVLALTSFLVRIVWPLGTYVLSFPSLAYLPQYLSFFLIGIVAARNNWLRTLPGSMGKRGFWLALVATLILFPVALNATLGTPGGFLSNGTWQSAVYALWDSTFSVGMCLFLIPLFRRFFNAPGRLGKVLSQHAFTVYVIHAPIIVLLALALRGVHIEQLLKFGVAAMIGVPLCFAVAYLVRKIPLADKIF
jgi:glucans biosynthesis protein C